MCEVNDRDGLHRQSSGFKSKVDVDVDQFIGNRVWKTPGVKDVDVLPTLLTHTTRDPRGREGRH